VDAVTARPDPDRLYELLPVVYRQRDAADGWPLRALLRVIAEQVGLVEDDLTRLHDDWFIETCDDWVVPYIGDLLAYRRLHDGNGGASDACAPSDRARRRILVPRRDVANTLHARRRRGAASLLSALAGDVSGWPAHAVELYRTLWATLDARGGGGTRARTADLRDQDVLERLDGPFDVLSHFPDVRRSGAGGAGAQPNIPQLALFAWRLRAYPVTRTIANLVEEMALHCYTFSALGNDTPLFAAGASGPVSDATAAPGPIRRRDLERRRIAGRIGDYYGVGKSFVIYTGPKREPVPAEQIVVADLTKWHYRPRRDTVAVDPELGRIAFPPRHPPRGGVVVSYHYGFSADMGGGEYARIGHRFVVPADTDPAAVYRVGPNEKLRRLGDALDVWGREAPARATIEIAESGVYTERLVVALGRGQALQIRAGEDRRTGRRVRPVLRLIDYQAGMPDAFDITGERGSSLVLDGLLITGRAVRVDGAIGCVVVRHCTLVPGWALRHDCEPMRPAEPSLEIYAADVCVRVDHSIVGAIHVLLDEVTGDPVRVDIADSIVDATGPAREAIGGAVYPRGHVRLTIRRSTVFGGVSVHSIELGEDSIVTGALRVARRQTGCLRFSSYVPESSHTPRRYACQPDGAVQAEDAAAPGGRATDTARASARTRVAPRFTSMRYGTPGYGQLSADCAEEITRGASHESEMGAFHDLYQPQRDANLAARLAEYTPASVETGVIHVT
jgi:hypothetical protein